MIMSLATAAVNPVTNKMQADSDFSCDCLQEHYSYLVLGAATLELLGAVLFVLNVKLGAILLVRVHFAVNS